MAFEDIKENDIILFDSKLWKVLIRAPYRNFPLYLKLSSLEENREIVTYYHDGMFEILPDGDIETLKLLYT